jgi:hypothetical protein
MNHLGLTVFAGNTPGLILDFDSDSKQYTVEFVDGRVVKTATVYWDNTIPADVDVAMYRQANVSSGEHLVFEEQGWDIVSADENDDLCEKCGGDGCNHCDGNGYHISKIARPVDIVSEPSDLGEWVDDHKEEESESFTPKGDYGPDGPPSSVGDPDLAKHNDVDTKIRTLEDKVDRILEILDDEPGDEDGINPEGIQHVDHDGTEETYWDRQTKPNPNLDEQYPSGSHSERYPGTLNPTAKVAKDCGCWDGYKRVPGTKPCAPGSCEKCDASRKESASKKKQETADRVNKVKLVPSAGVRAAAKRGLKYYEEGKAGDGFEAATADRARKIAAGEELTPEHVNRMHSFFERHAGGRSTKAKPGEVTAWDVAWLCWGGDAGRSWAAKKDAELERAAKPKKVKKKSDAGGAGVWQGVRPTEQDLTNKVDRSTIDEEGSTINHLVNEVEKNLSGGDLSGDREGNPDLRAIGDEVFFPEMPLSIVDSVSEQRKQYDDPNAEVWERVLGDDPRFSNVREEADWEDAHYGKGPECTTCRDPLVNGICHACGEDRSEDAARYDKRQAQIRQVVASLKPRAEELGVLFGNALAGRKQSVTAPSEEIFAIKIDGLDSHPENGGTGGFNAQHGDSPEYLKDVNHGGSGWIDATPELVVEGMPKVIELADSDESGEDDQVIKALEGVFETLLGSPFKEKKDETKKNKESAYRTSMEDNYCNVCNMRFVQGRCNVSPEAPAEAPAGCEGIGTTTNNMQQENQGGHSVQNQQTAPMGVNNTTQSFADAGGIPGRLTSDMSGQFEDIDGSPIEEGATYRLYSAIEDAPEIVRVSEVTPENIFLTRLDSSFPDNEGDPYKISLNEFATEDMRMDKADTLNPNEVGATSANPLDGTPETMDDAGPGQNDIPGERDLSGGSMGSGNPGRMSSTEHLAGRHYLPNQQKEFINEPGQARNLEKLVLEGTHYLDDVTASENIDDDFLFGV